MGATWYLGSDRYPYTVIQIKGPKTLVLQEDKTVRTDSNGNSDPQQWVYTKNPEGARLVVTLRQNGYWVPRRSDMSRGSYVVLGHRVKHIDWNY